MVSRPHRILDMSEFPVLYVDDEPENLRIFELGFRREFNILTATSGEQALQMLNENPIAVVLSDQRMPGMTGVELLARVREIDPKVMRVLVTAYGDTETLTAAVNDGSIYKYVPKPWAPEDMSLTVRRAIEAYALDRERDELVRELSTLNRVSNSINQQLELDRLLQLVLDTVTGELGYDAATLLFFQDEGRRLEVEGCSGSDEALDEWLQGLRLCKDTAPRFLKEVREAGMQVLSMAKLSEYEGSVRAWMTEVAAEEMLVVPLKGKSQVIGALVVDNRRGGKRFEMADLTMLDGLGIQVVIAIENARLVEELRTSREQVIRADRLGTLGTLSAGLAHEINNPLTSIHTFLSLAPEKRDEDDPEFWGEYHELAKSEVERIRGLVFSMERLASGGVGVCETESCNLGELADAAARLLARESDARGVHLELQRDPEAPRVDAVRDQLHQVLLNLILNAIHAAGKSDDGRVEVRILRAQIEGGEGVALEVQDNGPGIDAEVLERLFDPFFTTKGPDEGTGLGLTICQQLVANHDGCIEVRSRKGEGATFRVALPVKPPSA